MPIVVSNNLIGKIPIPDNSIIRLNLAWVSLEEARDILSKINNVYLDYPTGRTKPPKPTITLEEAIDLANEFNVKYFAVSNVEDAQTIRNLKVKSEIIPKIETIKGVENIEEIAKEVNMVMLDKEDLYLDCKGKDFEKLINKVRASVKTLELIGVVFNERE